MPSRSTFAVAAASAPTPHSSLALAALRPVDVVLRLDRFTLEVVVRRGQVVAAAAFELPIPVEPDQHDLAAAGCPHSQSLGTRETKRSCSASVRESHLSQARGRRGCV